MKITAQVTLKDGALVSLEDYGRSAYLVIQDSEQDTSYVLADVTDPKIYGAFVRIMAALGGSPTDTRVPNITVGNIVSGGSVNIGNNQTIVQNFNTGK